ncbi:cytochrome B [Flavihumibacter sp. R14]|nr:cytochrome B [Flavihumibacter soli]
MYKILLGLHSGVRYIVIILFVLALIMAITGLFGRKPYSEANRKVNLFAMISAHTQMLIGLILYFFSPKVLLSDMGAAMKDTVLRYWTVEHMVMMIFAVILITVGHSRSKKAADAFNKHRAIALFYGLALLVILLAIYQSGRPIFGSSM